MRSTSRENDHAEAEQGKLFHPMNRRTSKRPHEKIIRSLNKLIRSATCVVFDTKKTKDSEQGPWGTGYSEPAVYEVTLKLEIPE